MLGCKGALSAGMMASQMTSSDGGIVEGDDEGYEAVMYTKTCLVFQLKREVKSRGLRLALMISLPRSVFATHTSVQVELDMSVFLPFGAVVVRSALDNLDIFKLKARAGSLRDEQNADRDCCCDCERGRCEEAEDVLHAHQ